MDGQTDGQTRPLKEMQGRLKKRSGVVGECLEMEKQDFGGRVHKQTDGQTLFLRCEDASKNDQEWFRVIEDGKGGYWR